MDRVDEKNRRRESRRRNLAHKQSPYNKTGHSHNTARDYRRSEKYPIRYDEALEGRYFTCSTITSIPESFR